MQSTKSGGGHKNPPNAALLKVAPGLPAGPEGLSSPRFAESGPVAPSDFDLETVAQQMVEELVAALSAEFCIVSGWGETLSLLAWSPRSEAALGQALLQDGSYRSITAGALENAGTITLGPQGRGSDFRVPGPLRERGVMSGVIMPIVALGNPCGTVGVFWNSLRALRDADTVFIKMTASVIAAAAVRRKMEAVLGREAEARGALAEIGRIIGSSLQIQDVYEGFARNVRRILPWERITVSSSEDGSSLVKIAYSAGVEIPGREPGTVISLNGNPAQDAMTSRSGIALSRGNMERSLARWPALQASLDAGLNSIMCVPLVWRDRPIGVLVLQHRSGDAYGEQELAVAVRVANQIAGGIANAELHAQVRRHAHENEIIAEIGRVLVTCQDLEEAFPRFAELFRGVVPFEHIELTTVDENRGTVLRRYRYGTPVQDGVADTVEMPLPGTITGMVVKAGRGLLLGGSEEPRTLAAPDSGLPSQVKPRSVLAVPLTAGVHAMGALVLETSPSHKYGQIELAFTERVAIRISAAMATSELHAALRRQALERELLARIGRLATPGADAVQVCRGAAPLLAPDFHHDLVLVTAADVGRDLEVEIYASDQTDIRDGSSSPLPLSLTAEVQRARRGLLLGGNPPEQSDAPYGGRFGESFGSGIVVPIFARQEVIGALHIYATRASAYGARHLELAERVGAELGRALVLSAASDDPFGRAARAGGSSATSATDASTDHAWAWRARSGRLGTDAGMDGGLRIPVAIMDRQPICRKGLAAVFRDTRIEVAAEASDPTELREAVAGYRPKVLVYEIHTGDLERLGELGTVRLELRDMRLLVLAESATVAEARQAIKLGAAGFLLKNMSPAGLIGAVEQVASGGTVIEPGLLTGLRPELAAGAGAVPHPDSDRLARLSEREQAMLAALGQGLSNEEIAAALHLSPGTVKNYLVRIYRALGVKDRVAAAVLATRAGLAK